MQLKHCQKQYKRPLHDLVFFSFTICDMYARQFEARSPSPEDELLSEIASQIMHAGYIVNEKSWPSKRALQNN